jgi:hypothetical protein
MHIHSLLWSGLVGLCVPAASALCVPPLAYWSLDAVDLNGMTVIDLAGQLDGTLVGSGITSIPGRFAEALQFPGTPGERLEVPGAPDPRDGSFTVAFWLRPASGAGFSEPALAFA